MDKEVYWVEVEYVSRTGDTKPGVVYAFVPASDAIEAYQAVNEALSHRELRATNWLLIEPYQDKLFLWDDDEQEAHYERLCELAMANDACVFDDFYDQDEFERPEEEEIYWAFVEFRYLYEIEPPAQGGFANILVKAWMRQMHTARCKRLCLPRTSNPFIGCASLLCLEIRTGKKRTWQNVFSTSGIVPKAAERASGVWFIIMKRMWTNECLVTWLVIKYK